MRVCVRIAPRPRLAPGLACPSPAAAPRRARAQYVLPHWDIVSRYWQIRPLFCYDATGSPVMVEGIGRSNLKALLLESGLERAQLLHFWTHMMEWQILLLDRLSTLRGEIVRKAEIRDLDGLGMAHTFGPGIDFFKACAAVTSRHYVEIVRVSAAARTRANTRVHARARSPRRRAHPPVRAPRAARVVALPSQPTHPSRGAHPSSPLLRS